MTWQTWLLATLVVLWAVAQYGLAVQALRDLQRRPRVRGNNKILWGLIILAVPIAGALIYSVYGPTSFIRRGVPRPVPRVQRPVATRRTSDPVSDQPARALPSPIEAQRSIARPRRARPIAPVRSQETSLDGPTMANGSSRRSS